MTQTTGGSYPDNRPSDADLSAGERPKASKKRRKGRKSRNPSAPAGKARASSVRRRAIAWAAGGFTVLALIVAAAIVTLTVFSHRKGPGDGQHFVVMIPKQASTKEVAHILAEAGLVSNEQLMAFYLAWSTTTDAVPGEHLLLGGSTPGQLADCLSRAPTRKSAKIVVPEGFHRFSIATRLENAGVTSKQSFLEASSDPLLLEALEVPSAPGRGPESAEGYLFPATYELKLDSSAREVLERMVVESQTRWRRIAGEHADAIARLAQQFGWTRSEIITLASMVEKEAAVDDERAVIAGVFQNRLAFEDFKPKLLQSDPTSGYGCLAAPSEAPSCAAYEGKITPAMNRDRLNRYSTYTHEGLPPGPIANPGERSILAVLEPTSSRFLFFVATGAGRHRFSETLEEHNRAIQR